MSASPIRLYLLSSVSYAYHPSFFVYTLFIRQYYIILRSLLSSLRFNDILVLTHSLITHSYHPSFYLRDYHPSFYLRDYHPSILNKLFPILKSHRCSIYKESINTRKREDIFFFPKKLHQDSNNRSIVIHSFKV